MEPSSALEEARKKEEEDMKIAKRIVEKGLPANLVECFLNIDGG